MGGTARFARRYMVPYAHWYAGGTLLMAATNWIAVTIPLYVAQGIDALGQGAAGRGQILSAAGSVALLGAVGIGIRTGSRLLFFTPGRLVEAEVKHDLFARILEHQPAFLRAWPTGDLISRVSNDVGMLRMLAGFSTLGIVNMVTAFALTGSQMVRISPVLAGLALLPMLGSFLVIQVFMREFYKVNQLIQKVTGELSDHALSSFQGIATIQAFGAERSFEARFAEHDERWLKATLRRANLRTVFGPILTLGAALNVFLLLWIGGPMAIRGEISVGELVAFTTLVGFLTFPLRGMSFIVTLFKQAQASLERVDAVLYAEPDRPDGPAGVRPGDEPPAIQVRGLTWSYPDADRPALQDVSFDVPAGGTLGVLGPTGAGKSTLLRLIARLYNPPESAVRVGGVDVRALDLAAWRERMTLVPQRAYLFSESLRDNVLLGKDDPERLARVLALTALDVDVKSLERGVDTVVGEAGVTLSGGQRQRAALARGLARPQTVLLLDDVLSAVDHGTEHQLIESLQRRTPRPTTAIVAHRVSALQHADVIVVLEDGRVTQRGTHAELIQVPGFYRDTWLHQTEAGEAADG